MRRNRVRRAVRSLVQILFVIALIGTVAGCDLAGVAPTPSDGKLDSQSSTSNYITMLSPFSPGGLVIAGSNP